MVLSGRLVLDDRVEDGRVTVNDGWITAVEPGLARRVTAPLPRTSRRASSTSTCTAGAGTMRWAVGRPSTGWPATCCAME